MSTGNSTGLIRPHGDQLADLSTFSSANPASFNDRPSDFFVGVNNTDVYAHVGTTAHFDCLVARPNLDEHGPVSADSQNGHILRNKFQIVGKNNIFPNLVNPMVGLLPSCVIFNIYLKRFVAYVIKQLCHSIQTLPRCVLNLTKFGLRTLLYD